MAMTYKQLEGCRDPDPDDIDTDIVRQSELVHHVGLLAAMAAERRDFAKDDHKDTVAAVSQSLRKDGAKRSETALAEEVRLDSRVMEKARNLREAQHELLKCEALSGAIQQKGFSIHALVDLTKARILTNTESISGPVEDDYETAKKRRATTRRKRLRDRS